MLDAVIVMLESISGIVWRIDVDTLDFPGIILFKRFQCEEVVAVDEHVFRGGVAVAVLRVFDEDAGFEVEFFAFADPSEFEFLVFRSVHLTVKIRHPDLMCFSNP